MSKCSILISYSDEAIGFSMNDFNEIFKNHPIKFFLLPKEKHFQISYLKALRLQRFNLLTFS
jgi:hypothetical protein